MAYLLQLLANGLHNGMLYALLAYSYVLLHQVVPKPNLAHGALFALSGQIFTLAVNFAYGVLIFTFTSSLGFGLLATGGLCTLALFVFAVNLVPRFAEHTPNMMILVTLALAIIFMEAVRIGSDGRDYWLPPLSTTSVSPGFGARVTLVQLANILAMLALLCASEWVLLKTAAGRSIRAVSQSPLMAALCGTHVRRVIAGTSAASGFMALFGGVLAVLHFGNMSFGAGLTYGLKILFIAAAGGFSTPRMAAFAAFMFGEAEALWDGYLPIVWREAFMYAGLTVLLIVRGKQPAI